MSDKPKWVQVKDEYYNASLTEVFVEKNNIFPSEEAYRKYIGGGGKAGDYISVNGIFYEMDEYGDPFFVSYANVAMDKRIFISWQLEHNCCSSAPVIKEITFGELNSTVSGFKYISKW